MSPQSSFFLGTLFAPAALCTGGVWDAPATRAWYYDRATEAEQLVPDPVRFICGQLEWCPETGKPHLQFYVAFKTKQTVATKKLGTGWRGAHLEICTPSERSLADVEAYCNDPTKESVDQESDMFTFGVRPTGKAGAQPKLDDLRDKLVGGSSLKRLIEEGDASLDILSKHMRFIQYTERVFGAKRGSDFTPRIVLLIGEPGTGKSFYMLHGGLQKDFGISAEDIYDWQGDSGGSASWCTEDAVGKTTWCMQEFKGQHCKPDAFKTLCDRGPARVQCKGGFVECMATTWVITSNFEVEEWWPKLKAEQPEQWERHMQAVRRRITEFGVRPDYKKFLRDWRLEQRLTQQGGLRVREPRRVQPEALERAEAGPSAWQRLVAELQ